MHRFMLGFIALLLTLPSLFAQGKIARPSITGIAEVDLYSTNLKTAAAFYTAIFDALDSSVDGHNWANVSQMADGVEINFHGFCAGQNLKLSTPPNSTSPAFLREIAFAVDDVKTMKKYLEVRKITIEKNSTEQYFAVLDPEGHRIGFFLSSRSAPPSSGCLRIIHAGFVVKDRAAMDHFYKDILGFRPYWHGGFKDADTDWVELQVPDGDNWIEYMLNIPATADKKELGIQNHFSLGVRDIHVAEAKIKANGVASYDGPEIGRDGKWSLDLYDPDGTRVELMEFTPVQKPCCSEYTGPHPKP